MLLRLFNRPAHDGGRKIQNMIYLSGGLHSGWQQKFNHLPVIDPRKHGLTNPVDIQEWMVKKIKQASIVVCYLEKQNPGGYSMAFEIGVAVSLGKLIYIVDEKQEKYFTIAKSSALEFNSLDELINAIKL